MTLYPNPRNPNVQFERSSNHLGLPTEKEVFVVAVPKYHEKLYKIIRDKEAWLSENGMSIKAGAELMFLKKINTKEEYDKLVAIFDALKNEHSELFIDPKFHPKPYDQKAQDYVAEFIKTKGVATHYTFKAFYRVTVYPFGFDYNQNIPSFDEDPIKRQQLLDLFSQRQEFLIIPLYIIQKRGKTYEQMKTISYNEDGTFNVEKVNPHHFWRVPEPDEMLEGVEKVLEGKEREDQNEDGDGR